MSEHLPRYKKAYAVYRVDYFDDLDGSGAMPESIANTHDFGKYRVTVKEVVMSIEEAEKEVERLNRVNANKRCRYFFDGTHLFDEGGSHGSKAT